MASGHKPKSPPVSEDAPRTLNARFCFQLTERLRLLSHAILSVWLTPLALCLMPRNSRPNIVRTFWWATNSERGARPDGTQRPPWFFQVFMLLLYVVTSPGFPTALLIFIVNLGSVTEG